MAKKMPVKKMPAKKMPAKRTGDWTLKESADSFAWMTTAIEQASQSKMFCVGGTLPATNAGLTVTGVGPVPLPLKSTMAKSLIAVAQIAPFGKGTKTLVDTKVRKTFEIDASQIQLSAEWEKTIEEVVSQVATHLGLADQQLRAELYKLLLYERGGHFQRHRDSEKQNRMVGSLIVMLPSSFDGGDLVIHHEGHREIFSFPNARAGSGSNFVAFYADCEHEVRRVTSGRRLCLAYNLMIEKTASKKKTAVELDDAARLTKSIMSHITKQPARPLVFALEHQYTQAGLTAELLKGADRSMATLIESAATLADCRIYLAQVSRHLSQAADDGKQERWSSGKTDVSRLRIGETYEDELNGKEWRDFSGKTQNFGVIPFDTKSIVSKTPLDDWKPTSEEYEGYTGNAGNTLDRWYHRSAIVLWHNDHHFDVVAQGNLQDNVALYFSMQQKLDKTPKKRQEEARRDCFRLARAIIRRWPERTQIGRNGEPKDDRPWLREFVETLPQFEDTSLHDAMLAAMAKDRATPINEYLTAICHQHGVVPFADRLKEMLKIPLSMWDNDPVGRDHVWLSMLCCDPNLADERPILAGLCEVATERFCGFYCDARNHGIGDRALTGISKPLETLLEALLSIGRDPLATKLIASLRALPKRFTLADVQVPCLLKLIPWSQKKLKQVHPVLAQWFEAIRAELIAATLQPPQQPTDWTRPAEIKGVYKEYGEQLNEFLANPRTETLAIPATKYERDDIIRTVNTHQCDVTHRMERTGNRYQIVFTKTLGTYERVMKQHADDLKLLATLEAATA